METLLVKIFATALALSQVTTAPNAVKTQFDRVADQQEVGRLLHAGCTHMRKAFDIEDINLDDLIATAMDDPQAMTGEIKAFRGINFGDLHVAYRQFCKGEKVEKPAVDLGDVIDFYNKAAADLPDHTRLKGLKLPGASVVLDGKGQRFAEVFEENQRRVWVPVSDIPEHVQKSFIAAEDKRFFQHKGIDERGLIRAFIGNLAQSGRPQGGSTITQQVVKNLLVGEDLTYERKIREMIVATRLEKALSKGEILELYLNSTYLGRSAWGIEMAARSYFGKSAKDLTLPEGALLAGLTKGPNYYNPDRHPERARERLGYVLTRLQEEGTITPEQSAKALNPMPVLIAYERPRRDFGFHFVDQVAREAKTLAGIEGITANSYTVRSTINVPLQRAVESALQEGLWRYERSAGRSRFVTAEANLAKAIAAIEADPKKSADKRPPWQRALASARLPLYDVHWTPAIVIEKPSGKKGEALARRPGRRAHPAALGGRLDPGQAQALRCGARQGHGGQGQGGRARRDPRAAERAGHRGGAGEQDRAHPRDGRRILLSAEPAQSRHAGAAPARFGDQAAELSRGAAAAAAQHLCERRSDHVAADRQVAAHASRITGRRETTMAAAAAP